MRPSSLCHLFSCFLILSIAHGLGGVFQVQRKFVDNHNLTALKEHDNPRHARILAGTVPVDVPIGGSIEAGLYYTKVTIGTPPKNYTLHIDTGSNDLWVYCQGCKGCPKNNHAAAIHSTPYNPRTSTTAKNVTEGEAFCKNRALNNKNQPCPVRLSFLDGTTVNGYYVRDIVSYNKVSANNQIQSTQAEVTFGCITRQNGVHLEGDGSIDQDIEGLIGFSFGSTSMISQLASAGKVRKEFAHCLDTVKGGGIFAIGHVVKPKPEMTALFQNNETPLYLALVNSVDVGGALVDLAGQPLAAIDSGSTTGVLFSSLYDSFIEKMFSNKPNLRPHNDQRHRNHTCFSYSKRVEEFPDITFHFGNTTTLKVHPRNYLLRMKNGYWCVAWSRGDTDGLIVLGDTALSNKLVVYDIENMTVGWVDHDCSTGIEVEGENGGVCHVDAHAESSRPSTGKPDAAATQHEL